MQTFIGRLFGFIVQMTDWQKYESRLVGICYPRCDTVCFVFTRSMQYQWRE